MPSRQCALSRSHLFDPFAGDETPVIRLSDKIVRARRTYSNCLICEGPIAAETPYRQIKEVVRDNTRKIMTFRFCGICTRAMAHPDVFGTGRMIASRYRIGNCRRMRGAPL
jgi:hypothetical protein